MNDVNPDYVVIGEGRAYSLDTLTKAVNLVLMGRLSRYFDFTEEEWLEAIGQSVPEKFLELNRKAFALGRNS